MLETCTKILDENLQQYNSKKLSKDKFIESIFDVILHFIPALKNIDKHDVRQEICTQLLNSNSWDFVDAASLIHYIRAVSGNINKVNFKAAIKVDSIDEITTDIGDNKVDFSDDVISKVAKKQKSLRKIELPKEPVVKTVEDLIKEKGDYYITEISSFLGLTTVQIYSNIKENYIPLKTKIRLEEIRIYDKHATYEAIKDIIVQMFGVIGHAPFDKIGVPRSLMYQWKKTGIPYTKAISLIEALQPLVEDIGIRANLDKLYASLYIPIKL